MNFFYYVGLIGSPYVSDQDGLNRSPLIQNRFFVTFCKDRINAFLILILARYLWSSSVFGSLPFSF